MSGAQASWAASGTDRARARGCGIHRANPSASGPATTSRAAVAVTDRAKPSERASHGSMMTSTATETASRDSPAPVRPRSTPSIATAAMVAARTTLGSGETSTTNATRAARPAPTRMPRRAPQTAAPPNAIPTTSAQFAPLTAVRCESDDAFIAVSSPGSTVEVSPTASPAMSPRPGSGSPAVTSTRPRRSSDATDSAPVGPDSSVGTDAASMTSTARSPASGRQPVPRSRTRAPRSRPVGTSAVRTRTGAAAEITVSPYSSRSRIASKRHPVALRSILPTAVAITDRARPPVVSAAATTARVGWAAATCIATAPLAARATAISAHAGAARPRRTAQSSAAADASHSAVATTPETSAWAVSRPATSHAAAATGTSRASRRRRRRPPIARSVRGPTLTPSPDRATPPASSRRSRAPRAGRRRS